MSTDAPPTTLPAAEASVDAAAAAAVYPGVPSVSAVKKAAEAAKSMMSSVKVPEAFKPYLAKVAPVVRTAVKYTNEVIAPKAVELYQKGCVFYDANLKKYGLESLLPALFGLIICFYGGTFVTLIAAGEAYRMAGWRPTYDACGVLYANANKAIAAAKKKKGDGDDDAALGTEKGKALARQRIAVALGEVDPDHVSDAFRAISVGFLAVLAALRVQFAKAITLGTAIGDATMRPASKYIEPLVREALPEELVKWSHTIVRFSVKLIAVTIAWMLSRVITAVHSAIRGGLLFSRSLLTYVNDRGYYKIPNLDDTILDEAIGGVLACIGVYTQLNNGFALPFPLNFVLMPLTIVEYTLAAICGM